VSNAFSVTKLASANVFITQKQLETAKENLLNQQRIAIEKQTQALILKQTSQAAMARAAAYVAAAEVQKTENEAAKLDHITRNGQHILSLSPASNQLSISYLAPIHLSSWLNGRSHFP